MKTMILGGGITGLAAGMDSGLPVFEALDVPGGICSSYYLSPDGSGRANRPPADGEAYRFEHGGGHWIFGAQPSEHRFLSSLIPMAEYERQSAVWFATDALRVPYPLQNNLRFFEAEFVFSALQAFATRPSGPSHTLADWLRSSFGDILCHKFFFPFHNLYTAGLYSQLAPQDAYKSPVDPRQVLEGAHRKPNPIGYNVSFLYPHCGLNALCDAMAERCDIRYGKRAICIDPQKRSVFFEDGSDESYMCLLSTLPLNRMMALTGLSVSDEPDPYTSVLVLNIGGRRGSQCPDDHWLYHPRTLTGFHRTGIYSNVDDTFLPTSRRHQGDYVSFYIEKSFVGGTPCPNAAEIDRYTRSVVEELKAWRFLEEPEVVDPVWIAVAYTWQRPRSQWRAQALNRLAEHDVYMIGRYARWHFQGIAGSIREGLCAGAQFR